MSSHYLPKQGDVVWINLDPRTGHEQSGRRPALVISVPLLTERTGLAVICPITSKVKRLPYEILLRGCKTEGVILPLHIRSVDMQARHAIFIEKLPQKVVAQVLEAVGLLIGQPDALSR